MASPAVVHAAAGASPNAIDVADALLSILVARRATALTLAPQGGEYEVTLVGET